jgi:hypothetical protein
LSSKASIDGIDYWLREIKDNSGTSPTFLVGSKSDNKRITIDLSKLAREKDCAYF